MTVTFVTFLAGPNIQYTLLDTTSPVTGISFLLIVLRLNFSKHGSTTASNNTFNRREASSNDPLRLISVNVDSELESNTAEKRSYGGVA